MKRSLWLIFVGCLWALSAGLGSAQENNKVQLAPDLFVERLSNNVWRHVSYGNWRGEPVPSNGLLVKAGREWLLVDTAWSDAQTKQLLDWAVKEFGALPALAVITHYHDDRMGGIRELHQRGVRTLASKLTVELARQHGLEPPQASFTDSKTLKLGGRQIEVLYPGAGHTRDNSVVWLPDQQILVGGCLIKSAQARDLGNISDADLKQWPLTIEKLLSTYKKARLVLPGHGEPSGLEALHNTLQLLKNAPPPAGK
jgi:metallo-beta-lactamase class B